MSHLSVILKYGSPDAFGCGGDFASEGGPHQPNECIGCADLLAYTNTVAAYVPRSLGEYPVPFRRILSYIIK